MMPQPNTQQKSCEEKNLQAERISYMFGDPIDLIYQPGHNVIKSLASPYLRKGPLPLAGLYPDLADHPKRKVADDSCLLRNIFSL